MKLKHIFQSVENAFADAVRTDDIARMRKLMQKKSSWIPYMILGGGFVEYISFDMARLFVEEMDDKVLERWSFKSGSKDLILSSMAAFAFIKGRDDLAVYMLETGLPQGGGPGLAGLLISSGLDNPRKLFWLKKMLSGGYEKMKDPDEIVQKAIDHVFPEALDLFAAIGLDLHKNNEQFLRYAAEQGAKEMAKHLAVRHKADIGLALSTSRELGNSAAGLFLETLKADIGQETAPTEPAPTLESLAAEVKELKATVRELTAVIQDMRAPDKKLDKPALPQPGR